MAVVGIGVFEWTLLKQRASLKETLVRILLPVSSAVFACRFMWDYRPRHGDYLCYIKGACALMEGEDPYSDTGYIYPPLLAQCLAALFRLTKFLPSIDEDPWLYVHLFYNQFILINIFVLSFLIFLYVVRFEGDHTAAILMALGLVLINNPLISTVQHSQITIFILVLILGAFLLGDRKPIIAGLLAAICLHLKIYSLILLPIWILAKNYKATAAFLLLAVGLWFTCPDLQRDYISVLNSIRGPSDSYRVISIFSFLIASFHAVTDLTHINFDVRFWAHTIARGATLFFLARVVLRELNWRRNRRALTTFGRERESLSAANFADLCGIMVIASPMAWHHHYVLIIPLLAWYLVNYETFVDTRALIAILLIVGLPYNFDLYPINYVRLFGAVYLLCKDHG
jgi:hypothetical protein